MGILCSDSLGTIWEHLKKSRKGNYLIFKQLPFLVVPGAGIEPARIAPLVFETNASTNSAIRAFVERSTWSHKVRK